MSEDRYNNFTKEQLIALLICKDEELKREKEIRTAMHQEHYKSLGRLETELAAKERQFSQENECNAVEIELAYKQTLQNKERNYHNNLSKLKANLAAKNTALAKERESAKKLYELKVLLTAKGTGPGKVTVANYLCSLLEFYEMTLGYINFVNCPDLRLVDDFYDDDILYHPPLNLSDGTNNLLFKTHYVNWLNLLEFSNDPRVKKIKTQIIKSLRYGDKFEFCMEMATLHCYLSKLINIYLTPMTYATFNNEQQIVNILLNWNIDESCIRAARALFRISMMQ